MDITYIILAHKNPAQLKRLVQKSTSEKVYFYIHIDKNSTISPFIKELENFKNVFFLEEHKRENCTWGDIGIVKATINAIEKIRLDDRKGFITLLSGQDYPVQSKDLFVAFLEKNKDFNFVDYFNIPYNFWSNNGLDKINSYKINLSNRREHFIQIYSIFNREFYRLSHAKKIYALLRINKPLEIISIFKKRKFPKNMLPYGGSQWWTITTDVAAKIYDFLNKNPKYLKYHKYSLIPDEIFFQSIILNLAAKDDTIKIVNKSLTYANWIKRGCSLPVTFEATDIDELADCTLSDRFFARKFDIDIDVEVLNLIDNRLLICE